MKVERKPRGGAPTLPSKDARPTLTTVRVASPVPRAITRGHHQAGVEVTTPIRRRRTHPRSLGGPDSRNRRGRPIQALPGWERNTDRRSTCRENPEVPSTIKRATPLASPPSSTWPPGLVGYSYRAIRIPDVGRVPCDSRLPARILAVCPGSQLIRTTSPHLDPLRRNRLTRCGRIFPT